MEIKMNKSETLKELLKDKNIVSLAENWISCPEKVNKEHSTLNEVVSGAFEISDEIFKCGKAYPEEAYAIYNDASRFSLGSLNTVFHLLRDEVCNVKREEVLNVIAIDIIENYPLSVLYLVACRYFQKLVKIYEEDDEISEVTEVEKMYRSLDKSIKRYGIPRLIDLAYKCDKEATYNIIRLSLSYSVKMDAIKTTIQNLVKEYKNISSERHFGNLVNNLRHHFNAFDVLSSKADYLTKNKDRIFKFSESLEKDPSYLDYSWFNDLYLTISGKTLKSVVEAIIENVHDICDDYFSLVYAISHVANFPVNECGEELCKSIDDKLIAFVEKYSGDEDIMFTRYRNRHNLIPAPVGKLVFILFVTMRIIEKIPSSEMNLEDCKHLAGITILR